MGKCFSKLPSDFTVSAAFHKNPTPYRRIANLNNIQTEDQPLYDALIAIEGIHFSYTNDEAFKNHIEQRQKIVPDTDEDAELHRLACSTLFSSKMTHSSKLPVENRWRNIKATVIVTVVTTFESKVPTSSEPSTPRISISENKTITDDLSDSSSSFSPMSISSSSDSISPSMHSRELMLSPSNKHHTIASSFCNLDFDGLFTVWHNAEQLPSYQKRSSDKQVFLYILAQPQCWIPVYTDWPIQDKQQSLPDKSFVAIKFMHQDVTVLFIPSKPYLAYAHETSISHINRLAMHALDYVNKNLPYSEFRVYIVPHYTIPQPACSTTRRPTHGPRQNSKHMFPFLTKSSVSDASDGELKFYRNHGFFLYHTNLFEYDRFQCTQLCQYTLQKLCLLIQTNLQIIQENSLFENNHRGFEHISVVQQVYQHVYDNDTAKQATSKLATHLYELFPPTGEIRETLSMRLMWNECKENFNYISNDKSALILVWNYATQALLSEKGIPTKEAFTILIPAIQWLCLNSASIDRVQMQDILKRILAWLEEDFATADRQHRFAVRSYMEEHIGFCSVTVCRLFRDSKHLMQADAEFMHRMKRFAQRTLQSKCLSYLSEQDWEVHKISNEAQCLEALEIGSKCELMTHYTASAIKCALCVVSRWVEVMETRSVMPVRYNEDRCRFREIGQCARALLQFI